jgi:hypothetical protein
VFVVTDAIKYVQGPNRTPKRLGEKASSKYPTKAGQSPRRHSTKILVIDNYSMEVSKISRPPENPPEEDEDDKLKFQEHIISHSLYYTEKIIDV